MCNSMKIHALDLAFPRSKGRDAFYYPMIHKVQLFLKQWRSIRYLKCAVFTEVQSFLIHCIASLSSRVSSPTFLNSGRSKIWLRTRFSVVDSGIVRAFLQFVFSYSMRNWKSYSLQGWHKDIYNFPSVRSFAGRVYQIQFQYSPDRIQCLRCGTLCKSMASRGGKSLVHWLSASGYHCVVDCPAPSQMHELNTRVLSGIQILCKGSEVIQALPKLSISLLDYRLKVQAGKPRVLIEFWVAYF